MRAHALLAAVLCTVAQGLAAPRSVVRLTDAASRRPVVLVGTMHYNPHSVAVVDATVRAAARRRGLHATAIELCSLRWNTTTAKRWSRLPSLKRTLSVDEFQVAFESSLDVGLHDVVLADQRIDETGRRLGAVLLRTAFDLFSPAGWQRVGADLLVAARQMPSLADAALCRGVMLGTPLALARLLYTSPAALPFVAFSAAALGVAAAIDEASGALPAWSDGVVTAVTAVVLGRAIFVALIEERNQVLAREIRAACLQEGHEGDGGAAVVAVMGMAHLAGVREALLEDCPPR